MRQRVAREQAEEAVEPVAGDLLEAVALAARLLPVDDVAALGGQLAFASARGGTTLDVSLPLPGAAS